MRWIIDHLPAPSWGIAALRCAMIFIFAFFGTAKFAAYEAEGVASIAAHYPLFFWLYPAFGVQGASNVIGTIELATALLLLIGFWSLRAALIGGLMGVCTFLITLSFAIGAPLWEDGYGFPFMGSFAQFLFKDAGLLAACLMLALDAGQRLRAAQSMAE